MIYKGNPVSAGIAIGSAFVYDPKILTAPEDAPVLPMECELERYGGRGRSDSPYRR